MNNENIYINKNANKTPEPAAQQSQRWTRRMFNWMYSETPKPLETMSLQAQPEDQLDEEEEEEDDEEDDDYENQMAAASNPRITVNSPSSLDASTEFSSTR